MKTPWQEYSGVASSYLSASGFCYSRAEVHLNWCYNIINKFELNWIGRYLTVCPFTVFPAIDHFRIPTAGLSCKIKVPLWRLRSHKQVEGLSASIKRHWRPNQWNSIKKNVIERPRKSTKLTGFPLGRMEHSLFEVLSSLGRDEGTRGVEKERDERGIGRVMVSHLPTIRLCARLFLALATIFERSAQLRVWKRLNKTQNTFPPRNLKCIPQNRQTRRVSFDRIFNQTTQPT